MPQFLKAKVYVNVKWQMRFISLRERALSLRASQHYIFRFPLSHTFITKCTSLSQRILFNRNIVLSTLVIGGCEFCADCLLKCKRKRSLHGYTRSPVAFLTPVHNKISHFQIPSIVQLYHLFERSLVALASRIV